MDFNIRSETIIFLASINTGLIAGMIYDCYRVFRYYSKPNKILSFIEDLIFWLIISLVFFFTLIRTTEGILRGYLFVGFILGIGIYFKLVSKYIFSLIKGIIQLILDLINEILKIIIFPIRKLKNFTKKRTSKVVLLFKQWFSDMRKYIKIIIKKK